MASPPATEPGRAAAACVSPGGVVCTRGTALAEEADYLCTLCHKGHLFKSRGRYAHLDFRISGMFLIM